MVAAQPQRHWRDIAIAKSELITDAWEVTKAYAGRIAEWVLFGCMVMNIIEILPGVTLWPFVSNMVLGTQAVTLDVAGFGLASMADHARRMGDEEAACKAERTGWCLITIMVLTIALVTCGALWPVTRWFTDPTEKVLILVRVVMTVIYGHVLHGLRRIEHATTQQIQQSALEELAATFNRQILDLHTKLTEMSAQPSPEMTLLATQIATLTEQVEQLKVQQLVNNEPAQVDTSLFDELRAQMQEKMQQLETKISTEPHDLTTLLEATLVTSQADAESNVVDIAVYRKMSTDDATREQQICQQKAQQSVNNTATKSAPKITRPLQLSSTEGATDMSTKGATKRASSGQGAKQKAQRLLKRHPDLSAPDLAKKVGISRQYASKIIAELA